MPEGVVDRLEDRQEKPSVRSRLGNLGPRSGQRRKSIVGLYLWLGLAYAVCKHAMKALMDTIFLIQGFFSINKKASATAEV